MKSVETIAKVRRYFFIEGKGIKKISRELNIARNTVRNIIRNNETKNEYKRKNQPQPRIGAYIGILDEYLEQDWKNSKKRRIKATRLYELLEQEHGYQGGYDAVRRYVKKWRQDKNNIKTKTYIPLYFPPSDAYQFDWSHETVELAGEIKTVKVAHFRLCHSRKFFVTAYLRESLEMVMDAHSRAFLHFGGTCKRGIYDNMSTAVDKVLKGKDRKFNKKFIQMCSHYLVEPVACTPAAGWEKGQVEKHVDTIRNWIFTPRLKFSSIEELNKWLHDRCKEICKVKKHPVFKEKTIQEVYEQEKNLLIPVKYEFEGYPEKESRVTSTSLVVYDRNHYSVPCKMVGETVSVRAKSDHILIVKDGKKIACHQRSFEKERTIYNPWHYLDILKRKPGALRNGAPFYDWKLPPGIKRVQSHLMSKPKGDRQFVDILFAARIYGLRLTNRVCLKALSDGIIQSEIIINMIARQNQQLEIKDIYTPMHLQLKHEPVSDCQRYDRLRKEVCHEQA